MKKSKINEIEDLSCFGRFYDFVIKFLRNDLTPLQLEAIIEMYQILKDEYNEQINFSIRVEINEKTRLRENIIHCKGNVEPLLNTPQNEIAEIFFEMFKHTCKVIDKYNMDNLLLEFKKKDKMRTAPLEKINEGASPKTQFNENEIL